VYGLRDVPPGGLGLGLGGAGGAGGDLVGERVHGTTRHPTGNSGAVERRRMHQAGTRSVTTSPRGDVWIGEKNGGT
jgi:hypothetical protein